MGYPQLKESVDSQKIKSALFAHCSRAADQAVGDSMDPHKRCEGGSRQAAAKYSALLAVITDVGLEEEYRQYRAERRNGNGTGRSD